MMEVLLQMSQDITFHAENDHFFFPHEVSVVLDV